MSARKGSWSLERSRNARKTWFGAIIPSVLHSSKIHAQVNFAKMGAASEEKMETHTHLILRRRRKDLKWGYFG